MNKELIKKYKKEFDHWLNGGEVLFFYWEDWYSSTCNPEMVFNHINPDDVKYYVINDEYSTYRKALAEGKTVQYNFGNHGINKKDFPNKWKDLDQSIGILADRSCPENYRIKPEEPKFKVGDWVVNKTSKQRIVKKITSTYSDTVTVGDAEVGINVMLINDLELWKPKKGEYCWFWVDGQDCPDLRKLNKTDKHTSPYITIPIGRYKFCEPFIGNLPTLSNK